MKIVAATAFEFLKTYKSNCVFKTQVKLKDSGVVGFFPTFLMLNSIPLWHFNPTAGALKGTATVKYI